MKASRRATVAALLFATALAGAGCSSSDTTATSNPSCGLGPGCVNGGNGLGGTTTGGTTTGGTTTGGTTTGGTTTGGTTTGGAPVPNPAGGIQFISATPPAIGVQGSGQVTTSTVVFQVTDAGGSPASNASVSFTMSGPAGGTYIGTPNDGTPTTASGVTDASGNVSVILNSGNVAGPVTITASVAAGAASFSASSSVISIGGAVPSAGHLSVSATILNVPGLVIDNFKTTINVLAADRFTNSTILAGTTVSFYTEAGAIGSSTTLDKTGAGTVTLRTQNPRPQDQPPTTGPGDPLDGESTLIAVMRGEEAFLDLNGNGVYDSGEPFTDEFSEPFIDANDNGVFDSTEFYVDTNGNGQFDGKNGVWDGPGCPDPGCIKSPTIWRPFHILFSGNAIVCSFQPSNFGTILKGASQLFTFTLSDINGNFPIAGTVVSFQTTNGTLGGTTTFTVADTNAPGAFTLPVTLNNTNAGASVPVTVSATVSTPGGNPPVLVGGTCINPSSSGTLQ